MKKQWYETLFDNYSDKYDQEQFTRGTLGEYVPSKINWLLKSLGFRNIGIFGARLGEFSREPVNDFDMLVVAEM